MTTQIDRRRSLLDRGLRLQGSRKPRRTRLLIMASNAITLSVVKALLHPEGYVLDMVVSPEQALSKLGKEFGYDLVVLQDKGFPPGSKALIESIRKLRAWQQVLLLTSEPGLRSALAGDPLTAVLPFPFSRGDLREALYKGLGEDWDLEIT